MKFNYELTDHDFLEFNRHYLMTSVAGQKQLRRQFMMGPIFSVIFIAAMLIAKKDIRLIAVEAVVLLIFCVLMYVKRFDSCMNTIKKNLERNKKKGRLSYNRTGSFELLEEEIVEKQDDTDMTTTMALADIKVIYDNETAYYLYTNPTTAILLPKSMFADDNEKEQVVAYLKEKTEAAWVND